MVESESSRAAIIRRLSIKRLPWHGGGGHDGGDAGMWYSW